MSKVEERKNKIIKWLKDPYNFTLLILLVFATVIRLKYYNINTGIWWDEGEYLVMAKKWGLGLMENTNYWSGRSIIYPLLWAAFFKIGFNELFIRFTTELIPSILTVVMMYILGKEMYNKRIGLMAAALMAVFWLHLFLTARLLLDLPGLFFGMIAIHYFWKYYEEKNKTAYILLAVIFTIVAFVMRYSNGLLVLSFLVFLITTKRLRFLKDKKMWKAAMIITVIFFPSYFIFNYITTGEVFPGLTTYVGESSAIYQFEKPAYYIINYFHTYLNTFLFIFFIIGLLTMINLVIGLDLFLKQKDKKLNADFFSVSTLAIFFLCFVFIYKYAEPRYLIMMAPFMFMIIAKGLNSIYLKTKAFNKYVAIALVTAILLVGGYSQLTTAEKIINNKKDSFSHVKLAGLWINENSGVNDAILINTNHMEFRAYAERDAQGISSKSPEELDKEIREKDVKFIVDSWWFNGVPEWLIRYELENPEKFTLVAGFFFDEERKQPGALVFKVNSGAFK